MKKNKIAECRIIVVANPKPDKAIITKISVEEGGDAANLLI